MKNQEIAKNQVNNAENSGKISSVIDMQSISINAKTASITTPFTNAMRAFETAYFTGDYERELITLGKCAQSRLLKPLPTRNVKARINHLQLAIVVLILKSLKCCAM